MSHYFFKHMFAPAHACVVTEELNMRGTPANFDIYLMDDADVLKDSDWKVKVSAYDGKLQLIKAMECCGQGSIAAPAYLDTMSLTFEQTDTCPLFVTVELLRNGEVEDSSYYWYNTENEKGCLFGLPTTKLEYQVNGESVTVTNTGTVPAVGEEISSLGHSHEIMLEDNYFWLNSGESKTVKTNFTENIVVEAWNA